MNDLTLEEARLIGETTIRSFIASFADDQGISLDPTDFGEITENVVHYIGSQVMAMGFIIDHPERA